MAYFCKPNPSNSMTTPTGICKNVTENFLKLNYSLCDKYKKCKVGGDNIQKTVQAILLLVVF